MFRHTLALRLPRFTASPFRAGRSRGRRRFIPAIAVEALEPRQLLSAINPSIDGTGHNAARPELGSVNTPLIRLGEAHYEDGLGTPAGSDRPSARAISNAVVAQGELVSNDRGLSDYIWVWGQFLDHDIDLTESADPAEPFNVAVPRGDASFDPLRTGTQTIRLNRSLYTVDGNGVRQQINQITAFIDGSNVYGSDDARAAALRTFTGGRLKVSAGNLLPFNTPGLPNAGPPSTSAFLAGDVRSNENIALTAMHTVWVREHNRIADAISSVNPAASDQAIYVAARRSVIAELQAVTYNEFLPALLGTEAIPAYTGYNPNVDPSISNEFSTAAFRIGHTLLSPLLRRTDANGATADIPLQNAFFNPSEILSHGIDSLLRGAAGQLAQEVDAHVIDDVRNFLFGAPGAGGFDLASLNIQRGRDHGIGTYNETRIALGLPPATNFGRIAADPATATALRLVYGSVDKVDLWVGGLAERHLTGSSVGETFSAIIADQFRRLRDGDSNFYRNVFTGARLAQIERTTLADVIGRNTGVAGLQSDVFFTPSIARFELAERGTRGGANTVSVRVMGDELVFLDALTGRMERQPLAGVTEVEITGGAAATNYVILDLGDGQTREDGTGGSLRTVSVNLGNSGRNTLAVRGTERVDLFGVGRNHIRQNGLRYVHSGVNHLYVRGGEGGDVIAVAASGVADTRVFGDGGNDVIVSVNADVVFDGGAGDDLLVGGPRNDVLIGGPGRDRIIGGGGRDRIVSDRDDLFVSSLQLAGAPETTSGAPNTAAEVEAAVSSAGVGRGLTTWFVDQIVTRL